MSQCIRAAIILVILTLNVNCFCMAQPAEKVPIDYGTAVRVVGTNAINMWAVMQAAARGEEDEHYCVRGTITGTNALGALVYRQKAITFKFEPGDIRYDTTSELLHKSMLAQRSRDGVGIVELMRMDPIDRVHFKPINNNETVFVKNYWKHIGQPACVIAFPIGMTNSMPAFDFGSAVAKDTTNVMNLGTLTSKGIVWSKTNLRPAVH